MNEVQPLVTGPSLTSTNPALDCYDAKQNIYQYGTSTKPGSCIISDTISEQENIF